MHLSTLALLAVTLPGLTVGVARADVLACYAEGNTAMKGGDFAAAARAYATAREQPDCEATRDGLMFNEAVALDKLGEATATADDDRPLCAALYAYRRASKVARDATRPTIEAAMARLAPQCPPAGALRIVCEPAGGTVAIEGIGRPQACPAQFEDLRPRTYTGEVVAAGRTVPFEVAVPAGQRVEHRVSTAAEVPVPTPLPPPDDISLAPWAWTAIGLGVAAAGAATYGYVEGRDLVEQADAANASLDAGRLSTADYNRRYDDLSDQHESMQALHLGGVIAAGALLTAGITLLVLDETTTVEPVVGPTTGVQVRWGP